MPGDVADPLTLGGPQLLLRIQQQLFQIFSSTLRLGHVLLFPGEICIETLQHGGGVVPHLADIALQQIVQHIHPDVVAGAAGESTAVVGAAGVGGAQLAAAHGKHGAAAVTALQKAGIDIVIDLHTAVMAGGALLPQGTGGGKGAVVDDSLMMMLKHQMVALVPFDLGSVDLPAGVFALPQCADVEVVIQNALHRNDGPRGLGGAFDALTLRFSAIALGHARRGNALVSQVVGNLFVAPAVVVKAENLTHDLRLGGDDLKLPLLVEDIAVWRGAKPRAVRLPPLDNRLDLLAGVGDRHFVDEELKLDLQPVIIVRKVDAVADGDDADACVAQILQLY